MALMTVADVIDEITDFLPSAATAKIVRSCNKVIRRIYAETTLPEYTTFTTRAKVTTGTVSVTQDSTTATFSSGVLSATDPVVLVQIDGDVNWFVVTRNAADTAGVLSSKWAAATDSAATYTIVYPSVSFPAAVGEILRIWREGFDDLQFCADRGTEWVTGSVSGTPVRWSPYIHDSASANPNDDLLRILLTPAPESRIVFQVAYRRRQTLLTPGGATSQTIPLPDVWNETVVAGTLFFMFDQRDEEGRSDFWRAEYERVFQRTRGTLLPAAAVTPKTRRHMAVYSPLPRNA